MIIEDKVYGDVEIIEPVLVDLINSKSLQRLKGINQYGLSKVDFGFGEYTRFDHSVGVMLLLRRLGAPIKEQIAGLLHDISHTAFSHVIDKAIGDKHTENFQDKAYKNYLRKSEIPNVLKKHGYNPNTFEHVHNFPLLEQPAPALCADRIDYIFREMKEWYKADKTDYLLSHLTTHNKKIIFDSKEAARLFGSTFMKIQKEHWSNLDVLVQDEVFAQTLKHALDQKVISRKDLFTTDKHVLNKLKKNYPQIFSTQNKLKKYKFKITPNGKIHILKKFRHIDPKFLNQGKVNKLSKADKEFKKLLEDEKKRIKRGVRVTIHNNR